MKRILSTVLIAFILVFVNPIYHSFANAENIDSKVDFLMEKSNSGLLKGDYVPTREHNLPYCANWTKVYEYTYTNYYFSGESSYKLTLDAHMNTSTQKDRFKVYMIDLFDDSRTCVFDTGSAVSDYTRTKTISANPTRHYYFSFVKVSNKGYSSYGTLIVKSN